MNGDFKGKQWLIGVIGVMATLIGILSGFLIAYKNIVVDYTIYKDKVDQNTEAIQVAKKYMDNVLRPEVQVEDQKKMDKVIAWEQINQLRHEIQYLDHLHIGSTQ